MTARFDARPQEVFLLAGIGQDASAWDGVIAGLPEQCAPRAFAITDLVDLNEPFTMAAAVQGLDRRVNEANADDVVLCGLSLGALIATSYAIARPERVAGLVLSGSQIRPNPALMLLENALVRVLPASLMGLPDGLSKAKVREILTVVSSIDYRSSAPSIAAPTLVVCGTKDRANLPAARELAATIPHARLELVEGGGHELNTERPEELGRLLRAFLAAAARPADENSS